MKVFIHSFEYCYARIALVSTHSTHNELAAKKKPHEHHTRIKPAMSKEAMALLADVVYKQAEG